MLSSTVYALQQVSFYAPHRGSYLVPVSCPISRFMGTLVEHMLSLATGLCSDRSTLRSRKSHYSHECVDKTS